MSHRTEKRHTDLYRACRAVLGERSWKRFSRKWTDALADQSLSAVLPRAGNNDFPEFLPDLARLEETSFALLELGKSIPREVGKPHVNPTLRVVELTWKNLAAFLDPNRKYSTIHPERKIE